MNPFANHYLKKLKSFMDHSFPTTKLTLRQGIYFILHGALPALSHAIGYEKNIAPKIRFANQLITILICLAVITSAALCVMDSLLSVKNQLTQVEIIGLTFLFGIFFVEYICRLWTAPETHPHITNEDEDEDDRLEIERHHYRIEYFFSVLGIIDLVVVVSLIFLLVSDDASRWTSYIFIVGLFKLVRYIPGLELIFKVISNQRQMLFATVFTLGIMVFVLSTGLYLLENSAQPEAFKSIPAVMWWGVVTMTTVGYGDMVPITFFGRILGAFAMLVGIAMLAMPVGIIASGFSEEIKRRQQLMAWQIISNLSLFANLDASCIADIASCLKTRIFPARTVVVKKNDFSDSIFFIADGEVEVQIRPKPKFPVVLRTGEVFGEAGLIENKRRNASIRTRRTSRFLVLELRDFHRLSENYPELKKRIEAIHLSRSA
jgi:voltage-gated potassium channel